MSKILILVDKIDYIKDYQDAGASAFLFPLESFCVGYVTYSLAEIESVDLVDKYLLINRILDNEDILRLESLLPNICNIKGIVYEDIGVYHLVKRMGISLELIHYQNHFCTNSESVNFWLNRVDSVFVSNDLTYEEIKNIVSNSIKDVCLHLFGRTQVMYSRRYLLKNWSEQFSVEYKNINWLEDYATKVKFLAYENDYGTVMYSEKIYKGDVLLNFSNIKYFFVNTMLVEHDVVMKFLTNPYESIDETDTGFLYKETIYKLKGE